MRINDPVKYHISYKHFLLPNQFFQVIDQEALCIRFNNGKKNQGTPE